MGDWRRERVMEMGEAVGLHLRGKRGREAARGRHSRARMGG